MPFLFSMNRICSSTVALSISDSLTNSLHFAAHSLQAYSPPFSLDRCMAPTYLPQNAQTSLLNSFPNNPIFLSFQKLHLHTTLLFISTGSFRSFPEFRFPDPLRICIGSRPVLYYPYQGAAWIRRRAPVHGRTAPHICRP